MSAWILYDRRTGKRCQSSSYMTREQAEEAVAYYQARDARGQRADIHDLIPHIGVIEATPETFGSRPGDVVTTDTRPPHTPDPIECNYEAALGEAEEKLRRVLALAESYDKRATYGGALVWSQIRNALTLEQPR